MTTLETETAQADKTRWDGFDVVKGVLASWDCEFVPGNSKLHSAFYKLSQRPEFSRYFSGYDFQGRELDIDLFNLQDGKEIFTRADGGYGITRRLRRSFESTKVDRFTIEEVKDIRVMARVLKDILRQESQVSE